jgi:hypothetical protein
MMMAGWSISPDWHELRIRHVFAQAADSNLQTNLGSGKRQVPPTYPLRVGLCSPTNLAINLGSFKLGDMEALSLLLFTPLMFYYALCMHAVPVSAVTRGSFNGAQHPARAPGSTECMLVATTDAVTGRAAIPPPPDKFYLDWDLCATTLALGD